VCGIGQRQSFVLQYSPEHENAAAPGVTAIGHDVERIAVDETLNRIGSAPYP
jgi:hypothetical protein